MNCPKCKVVPMYDDPDRQAGILIYACYVCGNRVYVGYPRRRGDGTDLDWEVGLSPAEIGPTGDKRVIPFRRRSKEKGVHVS